jgi:hypothetical protein
MGVIIYLNSIILQGRRGRGCRDPSPQDSRSMIRWVSFVVAVPIFVLAGCGEARPTRVVPVTPTSPASGDGNRVPDRAATRPSRAIATH